MWVRLLPPLGDGKTWQEIPFAGMSGIKEVVAEIVRRNPQLRPYLRSCLEETFHQFILMKADHVLTSADAVGPEDRIVVVMPLTGG